MRVFGCCLLVVLASFLAAVRTAAQEPAAVAAPGATPIESPVDRAKHLLLAARHLDAVGQKALAATARSQVEMLRLAPPDLAKAEALAEQVWKVCGPIQPADQIAIHLQLYQVDVKKLKESGLDTGKTEFQSVGNAEKSPISYAVLEGDTEFLKEIEKWQAAGHAKLLGSPTLVTTSGKPVRFHSGGELPIPVPGGRGSATIRYRPLGTIVDVAPQLKPDGMVAMNLRPQYVERSPEKSVTVDGYTIPGLRTFEVDLDCEVNPGATVVVRGLKQFRGGDKSGNTAPEVTREVEFVVVSRVEVQPKTVLK